METMDDVARRAKEAIDHAKHNTILTMEGMIRRKVSERDEVRLYPKATNYQLLYNLAIEEGAKLIFEMEEKHLNFRAIQECNPPKDNPLRVSEQQREFELRIKQMQETNSNMIADMGLEHSDADEGL